MKASEVMQYRAMGMHMDGTRDYTPTKSHTGEIFVRYADYEKACVRVDELQAENERLTADNKKLTIANSALKNQPCFKCAEYHQQNMLLKKALEDIAHACNDCQIKNEIYGDALCNAACCKGKVERAKDALGVEDESI